MSRKRIYLDHAATSPLRPEAKAAMEEGFALWANPSSPHAEGRRAKQALEDARERIKRALEWDGELIFTSGASEAALLVFDNTKTVFAAISELEHDALWQFLERPGGEFIPARADGMVDQAALDRILAEQASRSTMEYRSLVCVQHQNSETGHLQDIPVITDIAHAHDALIVSDCSQSAGKLWLPTVADMLIVSAHKFGGPIGVGALLVRDFAMLEPVGGHERGYRRGTENLPSILGMAAALEASLSAPALDEDLLAALANLAETVRHCGGMWLGDRLRFPVETINAFSMPSMSAPAQVMRLDMMGFSVSQGSACSSGTMKRSRVLTALGISDDVAANTIRVSIGWSTTPEELEQFAEAWRSLC